MMYFQLLLLCLPLVALGSQLGSLQYDHLSKEVENLDAPPLHGKIFTQLGFFFNVHPLHGELYFFSKKTNFLPSVSNHAIPILSIRLSFSPFCFQPRHPHSVNLSISCGQSRRLQTYEKVTLKSER
jgi:hypothetical protein